MKIAAIHPATYNEDVEQAYRQRASFGTELDLKCATLGVFNTAGDVDLKAPEAAILARQAEKDGYDAVIVCGMCDFALSAVRGAVRIPVVGPASSTYGLVYQLARRFGVISLNSKWNPAFYHAMRECDCLDRMTSMRSLPKPMAVTENGIEIPYTQEEWEAQILEVGKLQVEQEDTQCIVVACAPVFATLLPEGAQQRLEEATGVMWVDPISIAIATAEMMVRLGVCHSALEYPLVEAASIENRYKDGVPQLRQTA